MDEQSRLTEQRRLRRLPSHLSDYHVNLPPTLRPSTMAVSNTSQSANASPRLQSLGMYAEPTTNIDQSGSVFGPSSMLSQQDLHYMAGRGEHLVQPDDLACELSSRLLLTQKTILDVGTDTSSHSASEDVESEGSSVISDSVISAQSFHDFLPVNTAPLQQAECTRRPISSPNITYASGHAATSQPSIYTLTQALPPTIPTTSITAVLSAQQAIAPVSYQHTMQPKSVSGPETRTFPTSQPITYVQPPTGYWPSSPTYAFQEQQKSTVPMHNKNLYAQLSTPFPYVPAASNPSMYHHESMVTLPIQPGNTPVHTQLGPPNVNQTMYQTHLQPYGVASQPGQPPSVVAMGQPNYGPNYGVTNYSHYQPVPTYHPTQGPQVTRPVPAQTPWSYPPTVTGVRAIQPDLEIRPTERQIPFPVPSQPVPVPKLPTLEHDSEREFADLKMALDHLLQPHPELSEHYKYRVLMEQLVLNEARLIAQACRHYSQPYTMAMQALQRQYGQPHQLAQAEIAAILNAPDVKPGDFRAFQSFALNVDLMVGLLTALEGPYGMELMSTGHVDRLLSKLPRQYRDNFVEHLQIRGRLQTSSLNPYNLRDLSEWLKVKAEAQRLSSKMAQRHQAERIQVNRRDKVALPRSKSQSIVYYSSEKTKMADRAQENSHNSAMAKKPKRLCLFCKSTEHYLSQCTTITTCSADTIEKWISDGKRCRKCGRTSHIAEQCTLRKVCGECQNIHLKVLHIISKPESGVYFLTPSHEATASPLKQGGKVYLKVVPVVISYGTKTLHTHAILDDGAERTIILSEATSYLDLKGSLESMALRTIRQDIAHVTGSSVDFYVSPGEQPQRKHLIKGAFTAQQLALAEQSYPTDILQRRYQHLQGIPIKSFKNVCPLLLIGADNTHLIIAKEPVLINPSGGPIAILTELGWALQGPDDYIPTESQTKACYFTTLRPVPDDIYQHVERLWKIDVLPYRSEKKAVRSRQDDEAIAILESHTVRVNVAGKLRYATPLPRRRDSPPLRASAEAVMPLLRSTERRLLREPVKAQIYEAEIKKLLDAGCVVKLHPDQVNESLESWFIPHHLVEHNGKQRLVFNCSFNFNGLSLNDQLLSGPTLGPTLIGVLLRFREYSIAVSGDIRAMFHQVCLLPKDQPLLRFIWRNLQREKEPDVYQWRVLPFGTTSSPCCATFALQTHVKNSGEENEDIWQSLNQAFYVDNCLKSLPTIESAKFLVDKMRQVLAEGGFDIRQWASNKPNTIAHLPPEAKSQSTELWLMEKPTNFQEMALGMIWNWGTDTLCYRLRPLEKKLPTLRNIYKVLATQYDPLGLIIPFTTRAKVIVRNLWAKKRDWDDPNLPPDLQQAWIRWENELPQLENISIPRTYAPAEQAVEGVEYVLHIFCDASELAYGSVAYFTMQDGDKTCVSFVMARSRVAPRRQLSIPRLELCGALTGAQLSALIHRELNVHISNTFLWSDSTTVLTWLKSDSCRFKVFVGTRVSEIQELTPNQEWRYVDSASNPADDISRGKTITDLLSPSRWLNGPAFLQKPPEYWPVAPASGLTENVEELKKGTSCGPIQQYLVTLTVDAAQYTTWVRLLEATHQSLHGAATSDPNTSRAVSIHDTELHILRTCQRESFPDEVRALRSGNQVTPSSRLNCLTPEWDKDLGLIRVGGRLRNLTGSSSMEVDIHPIVLDPCHSVTKLLISHIDERLLHPGPERVFAELRRQYWILKGRQAVKRHQSTCVGCKRWRGQPSTPIMSDLPLARLRLLKPPFYSTGVDCFGPYNVKIGRRHEKRWGVIFKCLTTRCVHLDLLSSLDTDTFLLALRRFIARRGTPSEILSDQGTNFRGANRELKEAFQAMEPEIRASLVSQQIEFKFNPPAAPHFGGTWEREIRSVKTALQVVMGTQVVTEEVLLTLLCEVEGILNAKPLGYVTSDIKDPDPVTPHMLLMGRQDASLPQVTYAPDSLTKRRWRHSQMMADHFWKQFIRHYLPTMQIRHKWTRSTEDISLDTIVMIVDSQLPRAHWPIGKVIKLHHSTDGFVRSVDIKVKGRIYVRPVTKLVRLPGIPDNDEPETTAPDCGNPPESHNS